jgi:hypothetical protein
VEVDDSVGAVVMMSLPYGLVGCEVRGVTESEEDSRTGMVVVANRQILILDDFADETVSISPKFVTESMSESESIADAEGVWSLQRTEGFN